jgi:thioredoxin-related protein
LHTFRGCKISYPQASLIVSLIILSGYWTAGHADGGVVIPVVTDWSEVQSIQAKNNCLLVLLVEQSNCHYCETIKTNFIEPALKMKIYRKEVIFRRLSIDPGLSIHLNGEFISTKEFVKSFDAVYAPTVLFLGPQREILVDNLVGISNPDYYGYYFEKSIKNSLEKLRIAH